MSVFTLHEREQKLSGRQSVSPSHPSNWSSLQRIAPLRDGLHCSFATGFEISKPFTVRGPVTFTPACAARLCFSVYPLSDRDIHPSASCSSTHRKNTTPTITRAPRRCARCPGPRPLGALCLGHWLASTPPPCLPWWRWSLLRDVPTCTLATALCSCP